MCHPNRLAAIGWKTSPFQYEVGVANLGIGIASLYAAFAGLGARAAVAIMTTGFLGGAAIGHIRDIASSGNLAPGNAGSILFTDVLTPIAILVLLLMSQRLRRLPPRHPIEDDGDRRRDHRRVSRHACRAREVTEPKWFTYEEALAAHNVQLRRFGGAPGLRDEGLLRSALERPRNKWHYEGAELPEIAASYAFGLIKNHAFVDGNKRIAFISMVAFLRMNGIALQARSSAVHGDHARHCGW